MGWFLPDSTTFFRQPRVRNLYEDVITRGGSYYNPGSNNRGNARNVPWYSVARNARNYNPGGGGSFNPGGNLGGSSFNPGGKENNNENLLNSFIYVTCYLTAMHATTMYFNS